MRRTTPSSGLVDRAMESAGWASAVRSGAYGWRRTMCTVRESDARTSLMTPGAPRRSMAHGVWGAAGSSLRPRLKLAATSPAVRAAPSWNLTPSRSQNVHVSPSFEMAQRVARAGSTSVEPSRNVTSVSKTWRVMSGTAPSSAALGSSVAGTPATPTRNSFLACAETGVIHGREKIGQASTSVMKKQARSINCNDIALFLYVGTRGWRHPFRDKRMLRVRYGTCSWDEQRVTARERRRRAVAGGERRENSATETPPKDLA